MTRRIYYEDAYQLEFCGEVTAVERDESGHPLVQLDCSSFYPESGGQMSDRGSLGGFAVLEVFERDGEVLHRLEVEAMVSVGEVLDGAVDATRRAHHRQQHTGQHVLSRVIEDRLGLPTLSSRLGESGNTLDLAVEELDELTLDELEDASNEVLRQGRALRVLLLDPAEGDSVDRGKIPEGQDLLRVVEIEGFDRNACGGTHCANTAEVGLIALTRSERVRGGLRLHFLCGQHAIQYRRERDRLTARLGRTLTTGDSELEAVIHKLVEDGKAASRKAKELSRRLAAEQAVGWSRRPEMGRVGEQPFPVICQVLEEDLAEGLNEAVARILDEKVLSVAILAPKQGRVQVVVARGDEAPPIDCAAILRDALGPLGGKGGGKPERAQGGFEGSAQVGLDALRAAFGLA